MKQDVPVAEHIIKETGRFLTCLADNDIDQIKTSYSDDPYFCAKVIGFMRYNHPKPLDKNISGEILKTGTGWELRRVRMMNRYPSLNKMTTEYVVLDFNEQGELIDLNTCITKELYQKFVHEFEQSRDFGDRQEIVKFLEKYRTAFLVRDIQTVRDIFAEEALIIVGRKVRRKNLSEESVKYIQFSGQPDYEYLKLSKDEFLTREERGFRSQHDIALNFSTFDIIKKNDAADGYGVAIRGN